MRIGIGALLSSFPLCCSRFRPFTHEVRLREPFQCHRGHADEGLATPIIRAFGFPLVLISISLGNTFLLAGCALFTPTTALSIIFIFLMVGGFFAP